MEDLPRGLVPFNPDIHVPQDLGLGEKGSLSTEFTTTMDSPDGRVWNIPTVWFDEDGKGHALDAGIAARLAFDFEKQNPNGQFPRFDDVDTAVSSSEARSKLGGATHTPAFEIFSKVK